MSGFRKTPCPVYVEQRPFAGKLNKGRSAARSRQSWATFSCINYVIMGETYYEF
jgi:hypothetical protein